MHKRIRIAAAAAALLALTAFGALNSPVAHADSNTIPLPKADPLAVPPDHVIPNKPAYVILSAPAYQAVVLQSLAFSYGIAAPTGQGNNGDRVDLGQVTYYVDLDAYDHTVFWIFNATNVLGLYQVTSNLSGRCLDADNRFGGGNGTVIRSSVDDRKRRLVPREIAGIGLRRLGSRAASGGRWQDWHRRHSTPRSPLRTAV